MQVLRHRLTDASGNPVAGHTAHVMEYETPEEAFYRGYKRVPIVTATSDDSGWLTWILPRTETNVYVVNGIEPYPVIITVPWGVPSVTVSESRTGVVTNGGVRLPATVDLVTELEMSERLAGITRDMIGELINDPAFMSALAASPDLIAALTANPDLGGTDQAGANTMARRDDTGALSFYRVHVTATEPTDPDEAVRKDYVDEAVAGTQEAAANELVRRDAYGAFAASSVYIGLDPQYPDAVTSRDWVERRVSARNVTSWDETISTGWWMGYNAPGAPQPNKWFLGEVVAHNDVWVTQTVHAFTDDGLATNSGSWRRSSFDGGDSVGHARTWGPWFRLRLTEDEQNAVLGVVGYTPDTLVRRDANAWIMVKGVYGMDVIQGDLETVDGGSAAPISYVRAYVAQQGDSWGTPGTLVRRDEDGSFWGDRVYVNQAPANPFDAVRKDYADGLGTPLAQGDSIVRRASDGFFAAVGIYGLAAPAAADHAANKAYVDGIGDVDYSANSLVRRNSAGGAKISGVSGLADVAPDIFTPDFAANKGFVVAGDTAAKARVNHTGTQPSATISDLTEAVTDLIANTVVAGTGITLGWDDVANALTINATVGGGTTDPEIVRDVIGGALVAGAGVQITVNDAGDTITITSSAVLPARQVISGTGLQGGGDLSADRTLSVLYGTAAGTAAQGNDSRIVNAVPNTRTVSAGTGLTGGGDLTANRSLAVAYGSTAGSAVQGNDTRVTADQAAATASIRTLGTGALQAAAGNHTHAGMVTGTGISTIQSLTQAAYDAIVTKSTSTLYVIVG